MVEILEICFLSTGCALWLGGVFKPSWRFFGLAIIMVWFLSMLATMAVNWKWGNTNLEATLMIVGAMLTLTGLGFFSCRFRGLNLGASVAVVAGILVILYFSLILFVVLTANDRMPQGTIIYDRDGHKLGVGP